MKLSRLASTTVRNHTSPRPSTLAKRFETASKDHDVFAAVHGYLRINTDRAVIDKLWNRYVAAWYEGGNDDPKLVLLRLDPDSGQVWADASSFVAGIKMLLGIDPKKDYKDKVAKVDLD